MKSTFYNSCIGSSALRFIALILLFCLPGLTLHAQWQAYTPALTDTVGIYDLRIASGNDQVAWAVAMKYGVTDSTYYWVAIDSPFFTKTSDGGNTWTGGTIPMGPEPYASNICPINADIAWASGTDIDYVSYMMRTIDGGQSWQRQFENGFSNAGSYINFVHFWDAQHGVAMGDPAASDTEPTPFFEIYTTDDGGQNWTRVPSANVPAALPDEYAYAGNYFADGNDIWFSSFNFNVFNWVRVFHSNDLGLTWTASDNGPVGYLSFADSLHGVGRAFVAPNSTLIRYTDDGGATWTDLPLLNGAGVSSLVLIPESQYLLAVLRTSNISGPFRTLLSTDLGQSWTEIGTGTELAGNAVFSSPTIGYAGEWQPLDHATRMYKYAGSPLSGLLSGRTLEAELTLAPNPVTDRLRVQIKTAEPSECILLLNDAQGRLVGQKTLDKNSPVNTEFDLSQLPAGVYTLTVSNSAGFLSKKVVKQ